MPAHTTSNTSKQRQKGTAGKKDKTGHTRGGKAVQSRTKVPGRRRAKVITRVGCIYRIAPRNGADLRDCRQWTPDHGGQETALPTGRTVTPLPAYVAPAQPQRLEVEVVEPELDATLIAEVLLAMADGPVEQDEERMQRPRRTAASMALRKIDTYVWTAAAFAGRKPATKSL